MPTLDLQTTDTVCIVGLSLYMVVIRYEDKLWTDNLYYPGSPRQQALSRHIQEAVREIACLAGACVIGARCWGISCASPISCALYNCFISKRLLRRYKRKLYLVH